MKLLNYRKESKAIHNGRTVHFAPDDGVYVLFRILEDETVIHIINKNEEPVELDLSRYEEVGLNGKTIRNIITDAEFQWNDKFVLNNKGSIILPTK